MERSWFYTEPSRTLFVKSVDVLLFSGQGINLTPTLDFLLDPPLLYFVRYNFIMCVTNLG